MQVSLFGRKLELRWARKVPQESWLSDGPDAGTAAGVNVTPQTALQTATVFACVRILAETLASLPLLVYRRGAGRSKDRAPDHHLYALLHDAPNPLMTSFEFRECMMASLALHGNAYAEIERDGAGRVIALWPLLPAQMQVHRQGLTLWYEYAAGAGPPVTLPPPSVLHLRALSGDGIIGYSPIRMAREAIGLAVATETFGGKLFGHGGRPSGVLEHPGVLSEEAQKTLRDSWQSRHGGLEGAHRVALLQGGVTWKTIGIPPEDSQFLATREYQTAEIARIYRIPLHLLQSGDKAATYASVEQFGIQFVVHTIRPWAVRWEQALRKSLFPARDDHFAEFLLDGLLRGDTASRYSAYAIGRQWGWLSADDVRELENMNPLPAGQGDIYLVPMNMVAADTVRPAPAPVPALARTEARSAKPLPARRRRPEQHLPAMTAAIQRLLGWEAKQVAQLAKRSTRSAALVADLEAWYAQEETKRRMAGYVAPTVATLAATLASDVEDELEASLPAAGEFSTAHAAGYTDIYVREHSSASLAQVKKRLLEPDPVAALEAELAEWEETRAGRVAQLETVNACNVFARLAMAALGVTSLVWTTTSAEPCPYCQALNGKSVGIRDRFAAGSVPVEGLPSMPVLKALRNPPLHEGCACMLMPG